MGPGGRCAAFPLAPPDLHALPAVALLHALHVMPLSCDSCAGLATLIALSGGLYTVPWHRCRRARATAPKATRGAGFNVLWRGRAVLSLLSAAWAVSRGGEVGA